MDVVIDMVIGAWETQNKRVTKLLEKLSDEQLMAETAPGRNRGIYLIGHLAAVSDGMLPIMNWGERKYPQYEKLFVKLPDRAEALPSIAEVRAFWRATYETVAAHISKMKKEDWFTRHMLVSPEDFAKEPHRNKLNILVNRANHHSYHLGQLAYLDPRKEE